MVNYHQPMYAEFPQGHYYPPPPPGYPYYPPGMAMVPNSQYYYPPHQMAYYMQPMQGMTMQANSNIPPNMVVAGGTSMPPRTNIGMSLGMHPSPQASPYVQSSQPYQNTMDGRFGLSHNSSTEDTTVLKDARNRQSSTLLGDINNSFAEQSFNGQDLTVGQCRYHKACSCFPLE